MGKSIQVSAYVNKDVYDIIDRLASSRGVSRSAVASEILERGVQLSVEEAAESMVVPLLAEIMRAEFKHGFDRLARLLVRTSLEAGTSRRMLEYYMAASFENDQLVEGLSDQMWRKMAESLRTPLQELPELIDVASAERRIVNAE